MSLSNQNINTEAMPLNQAAVPINQTSKTHGSSTVFMGPNPLLEVSLKNLSGSSNAKIWDEKTEKEYLERIKKQAIAKATEIIRDAKAESEQLYKDAKEKGYTDGLSEAKNELEEFRKELGANVGSVIEAIQGQSSKIFDKYREDLVILTKQAVEKILAYELSEEKKLVLEKLFREAMLKLDNRNNVIIKVNPDDEFIINDIISSASLKYPDLKIWRVQADSNIQSGGILLETQDSLIDNRIESRTQIVKEVLDSLNLNENIL
ncbi:FliH/SctL family protein [Desulfovibrio litoralis]|uniref:Flagellar assembly protein FliH n=1 Tax=Desulfovibrio litoralis DSM 11393 TaxID=1121455 RepID=A0A1M7SE51_9BACT|nr:FliH/SctL family protein [Desulfovibrio litoralis]SHN56552.1 flagellar assembly protein FliH [Desulfovibrio litoralis DSM 11393]